MSFLQLCTILSVMFLEVQTNMTGDAFLTENNLDLIQSAFPKKFSIETLQ